MMRSLAIYIQCNHYNTITKKFFLLCILTYFIDIHSPQRHIIFVLDDWLLMLWQLVVLTDYDKGPMTHHLFALCLD